MEPPFYLAPGYPLPSPYAENNRDDDDDSDEMAHARDESESSSNYKSAAEYIEDNAASMHSVPLNEDGVDNTKGDDPKDEEWEDLSDQIDKRPPPDLLRAQHRPETQAPRSDVPGEDKDSAGKPFRFDDAEAVNLPDPEPEGHPLGDFQIPFGPRVQETYAFERDPPPSVRDRLRREVVGGIDAAVATGRGLTTGAAVVRGHVAAGLRRGGRDLADVVEDGWPEVRHRFLVGGWLDRAGDMVREGVAALPPLERQTALARGQLR